MRSKCGVLYPTALFSAGPQHWDFDSAKGICTFPVLHYGSAYGKGGLKILSMQLLLTSKERFWLEVIAPSLESVLDH
jgi:hypothetical protein